MRKVIFNIDGVENTKFRRARNVFRELKAYFKEYCRSTSIHGFQYFGENRTFHEKIWWFIVFTTTLSMCAYVILLIYDKWSKSPVIVSLATEDTPIYQVPFPAVTICPSIKYSHQCLHFLEVMDKNFDHKLVDDEEQKMFEYVFPLCVYGQYSYFDRDTDEEWEGYQERDNLLFFKNQTISEEIYERLLNCSPILNGSLYALANFMGKDLEFNEVFKPMMTEEGLCFTFNMLSPKDIYTEDVYLHPGLDSGNFTSFWTPEDGYSDDADLLTYPRRALFSGAMNSLDLILIHNENDSDCVGTEPGYKVTLHMPMRVPQPKMEYLMAPMRKLSNIAVSPEMMTTSELVKSYKPYQRNCYFEDEKVLKFFKVYSKTNCNVECLTNYTLATCGCVPFYMPRSKSTPICGLAKLACVNKSKDMFNLSKLSHKLLLDRYRKLGIDDTYIYSYNAYSARKKKTSKHTKRNTDEQSKDFDDVPFECTCLKMCNDLTYVGVVSSQKQSWNQWILKDDNSTAKPLFGITQIKIFFQTNEVFTTQRNELYGSTDFLSNFGGLLGLFTGFSILSFMEITYFCSMRIFGNLKLFGRWYGKNLKHRHQENDMND